MSFDAGVINGAVVLDDSDFKKKLNGLEGASNATFKRIAQMAGTYLTLRGAFGFVNAAMAEFSKVEEGANKLKYAYTEIRATARQTAKEIQETYHVSEATAMNAIANIGDMLTGFGFDQSTALNFAKQISERGIDIASFKGLDQSETIRRMTVALTGNTQILQTMGIVIRQDSEEFRNQVKTIQEATGATEQQAKAQAIFNEILKQSENAAGDYLREDAPRTYAQELTDLGESIKDFYAAAGKQMVSATQPAVVTMRQLLDIFGRGDDAVRGLISRTVAMSAAFALLAKSGAFTALNNLPKNLALIGVKEKAETDAVVAGENLKRAEYAKTDAYRERLAALNTLRVARAEREELEISVSSAKAKVALAKSEEEVTAAKRVLRAETAKLSKAQLAESNAVQNLTQKTGAHRTALMQYNVATQANTAAQKANTAATTLAGRAQLVFATSLKTAKAAAAELYAALGPVGIAMIALSAGFSAATYLRDRWRSSLEASVRISEEELQAARERREEQTKENHAIVEAYNRLEELARYSHLNNSEMSEAQNLVSRITTKYDDFGKSIDIVNGKLNLEAEAWEKLGKKILENTAKEQLNVVMKGEKEVKESLNLLIDDLGDFWTNFFGGAGHLFGIDRLFDMDLLNDNQWDVSQIYGMKAEDQLMALQSLRDKLSSEGKNAEVEKIKKVIDVVYDQVQAEKQLLEIENALSNNQLDKSGTATAGGTSPSEQSKAERDAITAIQETELKIRMKHADNKGKIAELNRQIGELFEKYAPGNFNSVEEFLAGDRYAMNDEALNALNKILQLKEQILDLDKESNEEAAKFQDRVDKAYKSYDDLLASRDEKIRNEELNRDIDARLESGDRNGALDMARQQLEEAQASVQRLKAQYEYQLEIARGAGVLDNDNINELRNMLESAFSDVDKWQSRIDSISKNDEKKERENVRTVGGWSAELLSAQILGTNTAQAQTAKYSKQSAEHLKNIDEKVDEYGEYGP